MTEVLDLLITAKQTTDAAFGQVAKNQDNLQAQTAKTNSAMQSLATQGLGQLNTAANGLAGNLGGVGSLLTSMGPAGLAAAAGVGAVLGALTAIGKVTIDATLKAAEYGDRILDLAAKTDLAAKSIQAFDVMARTGNTSVEAITAGVLRMGRGIVAGSENFRRLGLDLNQLKQMSPEEQFKAVAVAIESLGTNAERSAARVAIFGKSGDELTTVLHETATGATELGGALSDDALAASAELQDNLDLLKTAAERVVLQFGAWVAQSPEVRKAIEAITNGLVFMAEKMAEWGPIASKVFDGIVMKAKEMMFALEAVVRAGTVGPVQAFQEMKAKIEQMHLDSIFNDVKSGTSSSQKPGKWGPSDADLKAYQKARDENRKLIDEENKGREKVALAWDAFFKTLNKEESDLTKWVETQAKARTDAVVKGLLEELQASREAAEERKKSYEDMAGAMLQATEALRRSAFDGLAGALGDIDALFGQLGITADSTLGGIVSTAAQTADMIASAAQRGYFTLQELANQAINIFKKGSALDGAISGAMTGFAIGGPVGAAIGGGIGLITGALGKLFGGASKAREEMQKLRLEFVKSEGGMAALQAKAKAAGVSLDAMFKAKSAAELQKVIGNIQAQLDGWAEAQDILANGAEKWGIAVADMGAGYASLQLDQRAKEMALFFAAATGASANMSAVTEGMSKDVLDLVAQYQRAGLAIPEALKPVLQAMLEQGKLVDENGNAYKSFEEAGITFGKSMEGVLAGIEAAVDRLTRTLARGFNIPINFDVSGAPEAGGASAGGPGGNRPPRDEEVPLAAGGIATGPTRAIVAEGGTAEAVLPLTDAVLGKIGMAMARASASYGGGAGGWNGPSVLRVSVVQNNREVGQTQAFLSRTRQQRTSPNANRRF